MKIKYDLLVTLEGNLAELTGEVGDNNTIRFVSSLPKFDEVLASLRELAFIAETIGHLQGNHLVADAGERARALLNRLEAKP